MATTGRVIQLLFAGVGFFAGYVWIVLRWVEGGGGASQDLLRVGLTAGGGVSALYAALLAALFWRGLPVPRARGLQVVISPASFTLSFALGALGIQSALWVLG